MTSHELPGISNRPEINYLLNSLIRSTLKLKCTSKFRIAGPLWAESTVEMPIKSSHAMILQWRHNEHDSVSNHQPHDCLINRLFRRRSKKTSKLRVTGLCAGNSPGTGEFPAQMTSYAENVSIRWRHHEVFVRFLVKLLSAVNRVDIQYQGYTSYMLLQSKQSFILRGSQSPLALK